MCLNQVNVCVCMSVSKCECSSYFFSLSVGGLLASEHKSTDKSVNTTFYLDVLIDKFVLDTTEFE